MGLIIAILGIALVGFLLVKGYSPHAVLLVAGLILIACAHFIGMGEVAVKQDSGFFFFNWFSYVKESFSGTLSGVGLMIMAIGGFVSYMDKIGASEVLVDLAVKPLHIFRSRPHMAAVAFMPIGQSLFITIPSAAGLSLLLMASVYPILIRLGVSRLSAAVVITSCTAFGVGPASAVTASAAENAGLDIVSYFVNHQLPLLAPLSLISVIVVYFVNTIGDRKVEKEVYEVIEKKGVKAPLIYAVLPVLPLILLIVFSKLFQPFGRPVVLDTTTAMFISFAVAFVFEAIRKRKLKELFDSVKVYFSGMANIFKTVVTLIVAADIFAQGLIALGFLDSLVEGSNRLGMGVAGIGGLLVALIFFTSILMGSGNASFFAFGPLVPGIASKFGVSPVQLILPMNMAASIGRTASPVSGVLIAVSELAGISSFDLAKRNALPMAVIVVSLFIIHFFF